MSADLAPASRARLTRALWLARAVMLWEQGASVWAPPALAAAAIATAGLWGAFDRLPALAHGGVVALAFLVALGFSVRGAIQLKWPTAADARARVELDSRLVHAPLSSLEDAPAAGDPALWALHRARAAEAAAVARVGKPRAGLAAADPLALRYALLVAAALAVWARGPDRVEHVSLAFAPVGRLADASGSALGSMTRAAGEGFASLTRHDARKPIVKAAAPTHANEAAPRVG